MASSVSVPAPVGGRADPPPASTTTGNFPLSEAPVVEVIPTRTLRTGSVVPMYIEAPLRAKPPDHAFLSPEEAKLEEGLRLQLYSDIAERLRVALMQCEARAMEHRASTGVVENRKQR